MKSMIEVKNLTKTFQEKTAVESLSFSVRQGEVFGLLGHNGAGKTTTIECVLGLKKPNSGSVRIMGLDPVKNRKKLFEKIGVQLQASNYQNNIRVGEICQEMSALYKEPEDWHKLLRQFGLESFVNQPVEKLSGGEQQKLSVVLALVPRPEIVFLDELTTGLDAAARREVWGVLEALKKNGLTIFLTTHYMDEAQALCDHILLLKNGGKKAEGTVEEIIGTSPYDRLEDAYLWCMGEEEGI